MKLDEAIKLTCGEALDLVADVIPEGVPVLLSIVVSHPGAGAGDAIVIGTHGLDELASVTAGILATPVRTGIVDASGYHDDQGSMIQ